jgi:hypothetical protein
MHLAYIPIVALLAATLSSQAAEILSPPKLERICGKLDRVESVPTKNKRGISKEKKRDLARVPVALYEAREGQPCCEGIAPVATAKTDHWGDFEIRPKHAAGGLYWLQVEPDGHRYKMLVQYRPKRNSNEMCTQKHWEIDENVNFVESQTITID